MIFDVLTILFLQNVPLFRNAEKFVINFSPEQVSILSCQLYLNQFQLFQQNCILPWFIWVKSTPPCVLLDTYLPV